MKPRIRTTYQARLCNSAGELDLISDDTLELLTRHLGKRLLDHSWILAEGDTIRITSRDYELKR